jgi:D-serine deaminase-like pyridoxal phosphate-dependent protein
MNFSNIKRPSLLIDTKKMCVNLQNMQQKALQNKVLFRPHFKTHQSALVANILRQQGIEKITVSSVSMAQFFANLGWTDITIAFPLNIRELPDLLELSKSIVIQTLISSYDHIDALTRYVGSPLGFYIKIDTGSHRCGLELSDLHKINHILGKGKTNPFLKFKGFLAHFGDTYTAENPDKVQRIYTKGLSILQLLKRNYIEEFPGIQISIGDTPSCSLLSDLSAADEIRPGNFLFNDVMQLHAGVCKVDQIAVAVACPVIDSYPSRNELLIYGGAVHFSKDHIVTNQNTKTFGMVVNIVENGWGEPIKGAFLKQVSQEHGIIQADKEFVKQSKSGGLIGILPIHSCLAADLLKNETMLL